jgi:predicted nucleic acid-binding protein
MPQIPELFGHRVYLDANVVIHLAEGSKPHTAALAAFMADLRGQCFTAVTSALTLAELLAPALRQDRWSEAKRLRAFVEEGPIEMIDPTREAYAEAARTRSEFDLSTLDALHVACAVEAGCTIFLTQDQAIRVPYPLKLLRLEKL